MASQDTPPTESTHMCDSLAPEGAVTTASTTTDAISGASGAASLSVGDGRLVAPTPAPLVPNSQNQVVLILCGLIASGKVYFVLTRLSSPFKIKQMTNDGLEHLRGTAAGALP